jgi:hypothetical protein
MLEDSSTKPESGDSDASQRLRFGQQEGQPMSKCSNKEMSAGQANATESEKLSERDWINLQGIKLIDPVEDPSTGEKKTRFRGPAKVSRK